MRLHLPTRAPWAALLAALFAAWVARPARADIPQVQHVVIVFQENRTPDNLFHGLGHFLPAADIADRGLTSRGGSVLLKPIALANTYDLSHMHEAFLQMYDGGRMDGANLILCTPRGRTVCPANPQYKYVEPGDVAPYFSIAENYGFANRMFQSNQGPSFPAHQFILGGTSQISATSLFFASDNPLFTDRIYNGCDAAPAARVPLIGPRGMAGSSRPCFEHATLTDVLDHPPKGARQGLSWRYYTPSEGSIWTAPNAIRHMCRPARGTRLCQGPPFANGRVVLDPAQILTDIQNGQLASVSWVIPNGAESDHAKTNDGSGPSWVASVVNAVGASPFWSSTVILIAWDDWGGWYDHVVPPPSKQYRYYENGFRVPLLVVSAYTPKGYVSPRTHTFGSMLKFIETVFGLPLIPPGTFVDARSDDLADFFDFSQPPRPFTPVPAPLGAAFFLHDKRPVTDPDDD